MTGQFDTWLRALGDRRRDLSCDRTQPFKHLVRYPGNVTTSGIAGTIKAAPDALPELSAFTVSSPVFADGFTTWELSLIQEQTRDLPADASGEGRIDLVYDVVFVEPGGVNPRRLFGGLFTVIGFVTESA